MWSPSPMTLAVLSAGPSLVGVFGHTYMSHAKVLPIINPKIGGIMADVNSIVWYSATAFFLSNTINQIRWSLGGEDGPLDRLSRLITTTAYVAISLAFFRAVGPTSRQAWFFGLSAVATALSGSKTTHRRL